MKLVRLITAILCGVPFRAKEWYNYQLMGSPQAYNRGYIRSCDLDGHYIPCPNLGELITYIKKGKLYTYRIVDFRNDSPNRDWLNYGDHINPVIEFVKRGGVR